MHATAVLVVGGGIQQQPSTASRQEDIVNCAPSGVSTLARITGKNWYNLLVGIE
jgi:hypothetical protein